MDKEEIGRKFNEFTIEEYFFYIDNYKKYKDFNTLGLYRSILENEKLNLENKIEVREYAHKTFRKTFDFFQLKDVGTFMEVEHLGKELTKGDKDKIWDDIRKNQEKILNDKRIKHRNFGDYSKHNCGQEDCPYNGIMIKQGSWFAEVVMHFKSDKSTYSPKIKSERIKKERRNKNQLITNELDL